MRKRSFCLLLFICSVSVNFAVGRENRKNAENINLLYSNDFDAEEMFGCKRECHSKSCHECETQKIVFAPSPGKKGKSLLHSLWNCDERAELKVSNTGRPSIGDTRWYCFRYYWPANRGNGCIICQFPTYPTKRDFRKGCRGVGSDIRLEGNGAVTFTFQRPTKDADITCSHHLIGMMTTNIWHTGIVHVKWTQENDGFVEIWWDGKKVVDLAGQPTYWADEGNGPYFKIGAYKGDPWEGIEPFEIFTDDIYIFNGCATLKEVMKETRKK